MEEEIVSGSEIDKITTIRIVKGIMIDLFRGYPAYVYYGIIEGRFERGLGDKIVDLLEHDGLIELDQTKKPTKHYRLTPKGIDFAISMINLEHSRRILKCTKTIRTLTWTMVGVSILTFLLIVLSTLCK